MKHKNMSVWALVVALILSFWFVATPVSWAHEGRPRLELGAERSNPGAELEVRGINIAAEMRITLALVGAGAEFALGVAVGDEHGDFVQAIDLPGEALAGAYHVRAIGANRVVVSAPLTLIGTADSDEAQQRDQSEPLLAPMPRPNLAAQLRPATQPQPHAAERAASDGASASMSLALLAVGGLAVLVLVVLLAMRLHAGRNTKRRADGGATLPG